MEPLIKDPPKKSTTSLERTVYNLTFHSIFRPPRRGQPPYSGPNSWSQYVPYLEVPLYTDWSSVTVAVRELGMHVIMHSPNLRLQLLEWIV